jgi:hypothetical protein
MRKIIILLVLFVTTCTQKKFSPEENLSPKSHLPSISNEIFIFNTKLGFLSEPGPEKVSQLFQAITKKCPIISSLQKEFMGYPQYIYSEGGITCIWNQSKEIISFEKNDSNKAILYRSYYYLGYPTLIEKKVSENHTLLLNWKWIQNNRITKPTLQRISVTYLKDNKNIEYIFNQFSGSLASKEEYYENKGKKNLDSWQFVYSTTGEAECKFFEKGISKSAKGECSLWNSVLDDRSLFEFE